MEAFVKQVSTYSVRINGYSRIFEATARLYRNAVDFFIVVCEQEWDTVRTGENLKARKSIVEGLSVKTKANPAPRYRFDEAFYKFPCYLRRAAIAEAIGKVSSWRSNIVNREAADPRERGRRPGPPTAGRVYPAMYRDNMFVRLDTYTAMIKAFIRNTWDWVTVKLRKSDADYISRHCGGMKECVPTLRKRGKRWFLDFAFEERIDLPETDASRQKILAVDLGINSACTVCVMDPGGTVFGREFLKLPKENDSLKRALGRLKKAQRHGAGHMPRLWAAVNGINDDIAVKTADFIVKAAVRYNAGVIVMEHLDTGGKKRGSKKQRLHFWKTEYVQTMVTAKAHRALVRVSTVCAWNTSRLAFDGSGMVLRGRGSAKANGSYSVCEFRSGKVYNCDLNASYNIGARYFVRALTKPLPATVRQLLEAKVPSAVKRSTCTLSTLISLNAVLAAYAAGGLSHGCMVERKSDPLKGTAGNGGIGSTRLLVV